MPSLDLDFDTILAPKINFFPVWQIAKLLNVSAGHVFHLIESGELACPVDLRNSASSRTCIRVPRKCLSDFLNSRKNLQAIADANSKPKTRADRQSAKRRVVSGRKARK